MLNLHRSFADPEEFYLSVLESLAEGILITDTDSRILHVNTQFEELTGYSRQELKGAISYKILAPPDQWAAMERRIKQRLAGEPEVYEHSLRTKNGESHWVRVKAAPLVNCAGNIVGTVGAISCLERQKELEQDKEYLLDEIRANFGHIIGVSPALRKVLEQIRMVAPTQANVLVLGESGTGKELIARAIHDLSDRKSKPLVRVNCASVPKELFESEFFGHVRGSFTGAVKDRMGRFELADGGTLFLDEIGEIPLELQAKLLRVLQEGQFERVGEERTRKVNVRIVAATNRNLQAEARAGRFREDLYYRLSVFPIENPPLRDRLEDVPMLAEHFLKQAAVRAGAPPPRLTRAHLQQLQAYLWPGNVRELQNVIERAVILGRSTRQLQFDLGTRSVPEARSEAPRPAGSIMAFRQQERELILATLEQAHGRIHGPDGAAALLGMRPTTLSSRLRRYGVPRATRSRRNAAPAIADVEPEVMLD